MDFEEEELERAIPAARHEFGHFTVARELGFNTGAVTIAASPTLAGPGGTAELKLMHPVRSLPDVTTYCENRVKIHMAGVIAEAIEDGTINHDKAILYATTTGAHDKAKYSELLQLLRAIAYPETDDQDAANAELKTLCDRLWSETSAIIEKHRGFIEQMAQQLAEKPVKAFQKPTFTEAELAAHPLVKPAFP